MKITGLITEYNPFHQGHQYHMDIAREMTDADAVVVVMSGDFVQRGLPALVDKYARTRMALAAGADCVLELPVRAATGSAEGFAEGAICLLDALGCVTDLVYGCECEKPEQLSAVAALLADEPKEYQLRLRDALRQGLRYPLARSQAAEELLPGSAELLQTPNNILAIEYEKAILRCHSAIRPRPLLRRGLGYHASATAIREACAAGRLAELSDYLPEFTRRELDHPLFADDFSQMLQYRLRMLTEEEMAAHLDVSPELAARITRENRQEYTYSELVSVLNSKNRTQTHIQRTLLHLLLGIKKEETPLRAARLLGFRRESPLLKELKNKSKLPLISKLADAPEGAFQDEIRAADLYRLAYFHRYGIKLPDEYHAGPVF